MSKYFENFPLVKYNFGDEINSSVFQNISSYVDVLDTTRTAEAFYQKQYIQDYDRPDTMSYKLYGTVDYYWTFYYMNDHLRRSGWPVSYNDLIPLAKEAWPHQTLTTSDDISIIFPIGTTIQGTKSKALGTIVARNLDLGQMIVERVEGSPLFIGDRNPLKSETIRYAIIPATPPTWSEIQVLYPTNGQEELAAQITSAPLQYESIHHYEDVDGMWMDIDPHSGAIPSSLRSKTHINVMQDKNDSLKAINVLSKESVGQVVGQWKKFMQNRAPT